MTSNNDSYILSDLQKEDSNDEVIEITQIPGPSIKKKKDILQG